MATTRIQQAQAGVIECRAGVDPACDDDEALNEELQLAIHGFDAARLTFLLDRCTVDPNRRIGPGGMPLLRIAIDAEIEWGIDDPDYVPAGECFAVLLAAGADPEAVYLGRTAAERVWEASGLWKLQRILREFEAGHND